MSIRNTKFKHILLTGPPGVGKTTIIRKVCNTLTERNIPTVGFYTEEILNEYKRRIGFDVVLLNGRRGRLARTSDVLKSNENSKFKVGKYVVFVQEFESVILQLFTTLSGNPVLVIDEIGKMELFSEAFATNIRQLFNTPDLRILATIPIHGKVHPLLRTLRNDPQNHIISVSQENRDRIIAEIFNHFHV